jgi:hypothetical protein
LVSSMSLGGVSLKNTILKCGIEILEWRRRRHWQIEEWLVVGRWCPVVGFGSFFTILFYGVAAELEQVAEGAGVRAFETRFGAAEHGEGSGFRECAESAGVFDRSVVRFVVFFDLLFLIFHLFLEEVGLDKKEAALAPFGVDHFDDEVHFDGVGGLEFLDVGFQEGGIFVGIFIGEDYGAGGESIFEGVQGGFLAAFFGGGAVGFCAVGAGGIDFAFGRHRTPLVAA